MKKFLSILLMAALIITMPNYSFISYAKEEIHDFSGEYRDNGNGTHSQKCIDCDEYDAEIPHSFVNYVCECGAKDVTEYSADLLFDSNKVHSSSYSYEDELFKETGTTAYNPQGIGAGDWYGSKSELKIEAKNPDIIIDRIEAVVTMGNNYSGVGISSGEKVETGDVEDNTIVHINNINASTFSFGPDRVGGYAYFKDITVYYTVLRHDFWGEYRDNKDGTHSQKCIDCDEYDAEIPHSFVNHVCECGVKDITEYSVDLLFDRKGLSNSAYSYENDYFKETGNTAYSAQGIGAGNWYGSISELKIEAKSPYITIERIEAVVTMGNNYSGVGISSGEKVETGDVEDNTIVHINNINASTFSFGPDRNGGYAYFKDIKVYYNVINHDFSGEYKDNGDGTHSKKCIYCDEYSEIEAHKYENLACVCGKKELYEYSMEIPFKSNLVYSSSYSYENDYFKETGTTAYNPQGIGAGDWYGSKSEFKIEAKSPDITIDRIEAVVTMGNNYSGVGISSGEKVETGDVENNTIVHINNINASTFSFGPDRVGGYAYFKDITVYYTMPGHDFTGEYRDNKDGTHSKKCINCNEYSTAEVHEFVNHVCECGAKDVTEYSADLLFDSNKVHSSSYSYEDELFKETGTTAYNPQGIGAGDWYGSKSELKIEAKNPDIIIDRIEAMVAQGNNYYGVGISSGEKVETGNVEDNTIVHINNINASTFSFGPDRVGGYAYFKDIMVYYYTINHDFSGEYKVNEDGTHSKKCLYCDEYSRAEAHNYVNYICDCGAVDFDSARSDAIVAINAVKTGDNASVAEMAITDINNAESIQDINAIKEQALVDMEEANVHDFTKSTPAWKWEKRDAASGWTLVYILHCSKCGCESEPVSIPTVSEKSNDILTIRPETNPVINGIEYNDIKKIEQAVYTVEYNGTTTEYEYGDIVNLKADTISEWYANDVLAATNNTYSFAVSKDVVITTKKAEQVKANIFTSAVQNGTKVKMTAQWTLPKGYTLVKAGIVRATSTKDVEAEYLYEKGTNKASNLTTANGTYSISITAPAAGKTLRLVGYVIYKDTNGEEHTLLSEVYSLGIQ